MLFLVDLGMHPQEFRVQAGLSDVVVVVVVVVIIGRVLADLALCPPDRLIVNAFSSSFFQSKTGARDGVRRTHPEDQWNARPRASNQRPWQETVVRREADRKDRKEASHTRASRLCGRRLKWTAGGEEEGQEESGRASRPCGRRLNKTAGSNEKKGERKNG